MPDLDRDVLLQLLSDLAAEDDAVALAAARAATAMITDGGVTWDDVLTPPFDDDAMENDRDADPDDDDDDDSADEVAPDLEDEGDENTGESNEPDENTGESNEPDIPIDAKISDAAAAEAKAIIDTLLARKTLFEGTRDELKDYQQDLTAGDLHPADVSYLRALKKRLSKK